MSWDNLWSGERVSVPVSDVKNVELSRTDKGLLRLMMYGLATNYSFAAHLPIFNAVVFLGVPIWIMIGPPAFMAVCDVYDVDYGSYDPEGTLAIPDDGGQLHTVEQPLRPIEAREGARRDVALWLAEKDPRVLAALLRATYHVCSPQALSGIPRILTKEEPSSDEWLYLNFAAASLPSLLEPEIIRKDVWGVPTTHE